MNSFFQQLDKGLPKKGKYIPLEVIYNMCNNVEDKNFSKIFRILLRNFLMKDYQLAILQKPKVRMEYLQASRRLVEKLITQSRWFLIKSSRDCISIYLSLTFSHIHLIFVV